MVRVWALASALLAAVALLVFLALGDAHDDMSHRSVTFVNLSKRRADLHWDDGSWGKLIGTVEPGTKYSIGTYPGHKFWFTAHGVGTLLTHSRNAQEEMQAARFTISSDKKEYLLHSSVATQIGSCLDRFPACKTRASHHECNANPGWMTVNCPASCQRYIQANGLDACQLQSLEARCTHEVMGYQPNPSLAPMQLDARFEYIFANFEQYSPTVLSGPLGHPLIQAQCSESHKCPAIPDGPWIIRLDDFIQEHEIEALLSEAEKLGFERSTEQGGMTESGEQEKTLSTARTSKNTWCIRGCEDNPDVARVQHRIGEVTQTHVSNHESLQVLSYQVGQFYRPHRDESDGKESPAGPRIMTFFMYLSDVEEGGETHFPLIQGGLSVKPKRGSAILWANMRDHDPYKSDSRTLHEARPVEAGTKLAANAWIHQDNYERPNLWGCTGSFS